jgi:hypothetical protein
MPYNKTTWNNGAAPGISATKLNNLETQYDAAKADLDAHVAAADPHTQYALDDDLFAHTSNKSNPHGVTADQAGAVAKINNSIGIQVMSISDAPSNIVQGILPTSNAGSNLGAATDGIVDASYASFGSSTNATVGAGGVERDYIQIDVGAGKQVTQHDIFFYSQDSRFYWYKLKYSYDGVEWLYAIGDANTWVTSYKDGVSLNNATRIIHPPVRARYWRIYGDGNNKNIGNHVHEWKIYEHAYFQDDSQGAGIKIWHSGNDGAGSGLDTDKFQGKVPSDFADKGDLERNWYDDFQLWLELYYKGYISQIDASNAKALTFDGFLNTDNVDTSNTTTVVDTTNKKVICPGTISQFKQLDHNGSGGYYSWIVQAYEGAQVFTAGSSGVIESVEVALLRENSPPSLRVSIFSVDANGVPQTELGAQVVAAGNIAADWTFKKISFTNPIKVVNGTKYAVVLQTDGNTGDATTPHKYQWGRTQTTDVTGTTGFTSDTSGTSWTAITRDHGVIVNIKSYSNSVLSGKAKSLSFTPSKAKLYISKKIPANTSVAYTLSDDGGTNYKNGTLITSRSDPKFAGYTEEEWEFTISGTNLKLKASLTTTDVGSTPEVKRYGLHFI